jgi:hypothetical protein
MGASREVLPDEKIGPTAFQDPTSPFAWPPVPAGGFPLHPLTPPFLHHSPGGQLSGISENYRKALSLLGIHWLSGKTEQPPLSSLGIPKSGRMIRIKLTFGSIPKSDITQKGMELGYILAT